MRCVAVSPSAGLSGFAAFVISSILPLSINVRMRVLPKPSARPSWASVAAFGATNFWPLSVAVNVSGSHVGLPRDFQRETVSRGATELARWANSLKASNEALIVVFKNGLKVIAYCWRLVRSTEGFRT